MAIQEIYRLECRDGLGVHTSEERGEEVARLMKLWIKRHMDVEDRPGFFDDFPIVLEASRELREQFRFGCASEAALKEWFDADIFEQVMATGNVNLVKYQSDEFFIGESGMQIAFIPGVIREVIN